MAGNLTIVTATVLDEDMTLTVTQLCESLGLEKDQLVSFVEEGLVEPLGSNPENWQFPGPALKRLRIAARLQRDLEIDLPGAILAVDLLEELQRLRARVRALESALRESDQL